MGHAALEDLSTITRVSPSSREGTERWAGARLPAILGDMVGVTAAGHGARMARARRALDGLSVGDAFGERFFGEPAVVAERIAGRVLPAAPWRHTDDTQMALAIVEVLDQRGYIEQDLLAGSFARRYTRDPRRGYGGMAHQILQAIAAGEPWRIVSSSAFGGKGSMGNGGAMRAAPIGAYFADDYARAAAEARASAEVTHAHPEGQAGAIAVAVAAGWAARSGEGNVDGTAPLEAVLDHTPAGPTRDGIVTAASLDLGTPAEEAARLLGSGQRVLAEDTVAFALWCAARHTNDYEAALWATVSGLGDRDTTCAICGGIVALAIGGDRSIPTAWLEAREPLAAG